MWYTIIIMTPLQSDRSDLDAAIAALNSSDFPVLCEYANTWFHADRNYDGWVEANPQLARQFKRNFERLRPVANFAESSLTRLTGDGPALIFASLLGNPLKHELHRCPGCGMYFRTAASNKYFCKRPCLIKFRIKRGRDIERAKKLVKMATLLDTHGDDPNWKEWLHANSDFSRTYITRAVRQGYFDNDGCTTQKTRDFWKNLREFKLR